MLILRFLHIASLVHLCCLCFEMVEVEKELRGLRRTYKLYSQCSGQHVRILEKRVDARAHSAAPHVNLSFVSVHARHSPNAMNIVGERSGRFLCFSRKGKLVTRARGRRRLCLFQEGFSEDHFTVLQSVGEPAWFVGFDRRGRALRGPAHARAPRLRRCFRFVKRAHGYGPGADPPRPGPRIRDPSRLKDLLGEPLRRAVPARR